jgi:hypothetical protein
MRPTFAIWLDDGQADYGIARPRLTFAGRAGIALVALAVAGMGVNNVYSQMAANSGPAQVSDRVANAAPAPLIEEGRATTGSATTRPRLQPIGLAPIGATDTRALAEPLGDPRTFVGSAPNFPVAPEEHAPVAAELTPLDRTLAKPDEKPRVVKKKSAAKADSKHADTAGIGPWGFRDTPWSGRDVRTARRGPFGAAFW